jgi:dephospho-CoA kinase
MKKIGITGIIGSGKSSVGKILTELGYSILDADKVVHYLYKNSKDLRKKIAERFGNEVLTESGVSREELAKIIFENNEAREDLEKLVYPFLEKEILSFWKSEEQIGSEFVFLEAALFHKIPSILKKLDQVWEVQAPQEKLLERLLGRGMKKEDALARLELQKENKIHISSSKIKELKNYGSIEELKEEILLFLKKLV